MWHIKRDDDGEWEYSCANSAYGAVLGTAPTLERAKVELAIAEAEMFERPFSPTIQRTMRRNPKLYAKDYPDPTGGLDDLPVG